MKHENEFDELARQKLEGRSIPFEESDWTAMQGLLKAEKSDRSGVFGRLTKWLGGAVLLAILGVGVWKYTDRSPAEKGRTALATSVVEQTIATEEPAMPQPDKIEREQSGTAANDPSINQLEVARSTASTTDQHGPSVGTPNRTANAEMLANVASGATRSSSSRLDHGTQGSTPLPEKNSSPSTNIGPTSTYPTAFNPTTTNTSFPAEGEVNSPSIAGTSEPTTKADAITYPIGTRFVSKLDEDDIDPIALESSAANAGQVGEISSVVEPGIAATNKVDLPAKRESGTTEKDGEVSNTTGGMNVATTTVPQVKNGDQEPFVDLATSETISARDTSSTDQEEQVETTVNDTTTTLAPEPLDISTLITPRSPWQLSALGGAMTTTTRYTGANSEDWKNAVQNQWSPNVGVELVHMGRNFGIGTGVHYSTYSEQIDISAKDRSISTLRNFWYLSAIDTTILFITDTVQQGGETYYYGQSITTTINVLTQGTDSSTSTMRIRDARSTRNNVNYVEIPLLLDAHLVQGRWNFGLRGGPTVGLLTGRKGSLPNSSGEGYTALNDQPFREVVFGWTARAYVRYRFNAAWSIGVEPMVRGQLDNTLGSGDLSRKSTAYGGVLSLSYLLR